MMGWLRQSVLLTAAFVAGGLITLSFTSTASPDALPPVGSDPAHASLMIDFGDDRIEIVQGIPVTATTSVFDALLYATSELDVTIVSRDYGAGMGHFVEQLDGIPRTGDERWWHYWINNKFAQVGAGNHTLQPGDTILWKLTPGLLSL